MKWVILIVIILAAAGAGVYFFVLKQPAQEEQPKGPAQPVAEQPRELTDAEKQELATKKLDDLRRLARSNPDDVIGMKALRQQIEEFGDRATIMKAEAVFSTATSKYDDAAKKAYDKLSAEIKQKFQAELETGAEAPLIKKEKYERLLLLFDKFPAQYMSGEYAAMLSKLRPAMGMRKSDSRRSCSPMARTMNSQ